MPGLNDIEALKQIITIVAKFKLSQSLLMLRKRKEMN